ncbi:hypothetical protein CLOM_g462 [Closterium sp. NIES-68]|nr:hypothetical protein CLOM_g462 [Closterium sp. NIES-68]
MESEREKRKREWAAKSLAEAEERRVRKAVRAALIKAESARSGEECRLLESNARIAREISQSLEKSKERQQQKKERLQEKEDPPEQVEAKIQQLLRLILECGRAPAIANGAHETVANRSASDHLLKRDKDAVSTVQLSRVTGCTVTASTLTPSRVMGGLVIHTGAGLSTAAGIPDFRGPKGVWTLQGEGRWEEAAAAMGRRYEEASPTEGHMAVAALVRAGIVAHVVTQNVDGLHLRSGVPSDRMSELHGSVYRERCRECGARYLRPFDVTAARGSSYHRHKTGRACTAVVGGGAAGNATALAAARDAAADGAAVGDASKSASLGVELAARKECKQEEEGREMDDEDRKQQRVPVVLKPSGPTVVEGRMPTGGGRVKEEVREVESEGRKERECGGGVLGRGEDGEDKEEKEDRGVNQGYAKMCYSGESGGRGGKEEKHAVMRVCEGREVWEEEQGRDGKQEDRRMCGGEFVDSIVHFGERIDDEEEEGKEMKYEGSTVAVGRVKGENRGVCEGNRSVCGGELVDSIVHFGERIDEEELRRATEASSGAHVALCLGSSFKVPPASKLPRLAAHLVIINLQRTSLDRHARIAIRARIDSVLPRLLHLLHLSLPAYCSKDQGEEEEAAIENLNSPPCHVGSKGAEQTQAGSFISLH